MSVNIKCKNTMPQEHELKCFPNYYDAVARGDKNFEVRRDDRGFQKGDVLILQRTDPDKPHRVKTDYSGKVVHELKRRVSYILTGGQFGIEPGYVVMALEPVIADRVDNELKTSEI